MLHVEPIDYDLPCGGCAYIYCDVLSTYTAQTGALGTREGGLEVVEHPDSSCATVSP